MNVIRENIKRILLLILIVGIGSCENLQEDLNKETFDNPILIGMVSDVSIGRQTAESIFFAAKLAVDEINSQGGVTIDGEQRKIQLIYRDSGGDPAKGLAIIEELHSMGVEVIIGPMVSAVAVPMASKCIEKGILMMSYSSTIPLISELQDNDLIWRTCPSDAFSGWAMAEYAMEQMNINRAAILCRDDNFGNALSEIIQDKFEAMGGIIAEKEKYPAEGIDLNKYDFSPHIEKIMYSEPQLIFSIIFEAEVGKITQDIWKSPLYRENDNRPKIFLNDGAFPNEVLTNGQPEVIGNIIGITTTDESNTNYSTFKENYSTKYGFGPIAYAEHAYDAVYSIIYAIMNGQSESAEDIKNHLRLVTNNSINEDDTKINVNQFDIAKGLLLSGIDIDYQGASGPIDFDQNGDPSPVFIIWGIENNEYIEIKKLKKGY